MWWTIRPISSMCPTTASSGPPAVPLTRATLEPTLSLVTSANDAAASRKTAAAACSYPEGPGAVSRLRRTSGTGMAHDCSDRPDAGRSPVARRAPITAAPDSGYADGDREAEGGLCAAPLEQLPQHEREDAAVLEVLDLLG